MSVRHGAGRHILDARARRRRLPRDRERDDAPAVEEQEPANRTAEEQLALLVGQLRVPVHLFREREIAQEHGEDLGQHVDGRAPANPAVIREVFAARRVGLHERVEIRAELARKPQPGGRRMPLRVERGGDRRAHDRVVAIFLAIDQLGHGRGQPARRGEGFDACLRPEAHLVQPGLQPRAKLRRQRRQPRRRQLFDADFEQQLTIHDRSPARSTTRPTPWRSRRRAAARGGRTPCAPSRRCSHSHQGH